LSNVVYGGSGGVGLVFLFRLGVGPGARPTRKRASFMKVASHVVLGVGSVVVSHACVFRPREPDGPRALTRPLRNSPDAPMQSVLVIQDVFTTKGGCTAAPPGSADYRRSASAMCPIWAHEIRRAAHSG
jgi:hypothetical protein